MGTNGRFTFGCIWLRKSCVPCTSISMKNTIHLQCILSTHFPVRVHPVHHVATEPAITQTGRKLHIEKQKKGGKNTLPRPNTDLAAAVVKTHFLRIFLQISAFSNREPRTIKLSCHAPLQSAVWQLCGSCVGRK